MITLKAKVLNVLQAMHDQPGIAVADATITAVLDHFSDPANISNGMTIEFCKAAGMEPQGYAGVMGDKDVYVKERMLVGIVAVMKAAKEELSSDIKPKSIHPD